MQHTYGPLTLDVPDGWEEENLIVLKGPAGQGARESVVVRRVPVAAGTSLDMLAEAEEASLRQTVGQLVVHGKMDLQLGGYRAIVREVAFPGAMGQIRQVQVALLAERTFLVFCGSALDDARFGVMRERVMRLVNGSRLEIATAPAIAAARGKAHAAVLALKAQARASTKRSGKKPAKEPAKKPAQKPKKKPAKKPAKKKKR